MLNFKEYVEMLNEKLIVFRGKRQKEGRVIFLAGGAGCFAKDTEILMFDGTKKMVQDIKVFDKIMGADSNPRTVTKLFNGFEKMINVLDTKGNIVYTSNLSHIHTFVCSFNKCGFIKNELYDMTLEEYNNLKSSAKKCLKLFYNDIPVKFQNSTHLKIDPYILGYWIGDGVRSNSNLIIHNNNYHIVEYMNNLLESENLQLNEVKSDKVNCLIYSISRSHTSYFKRKNIYRDYLTENGFDGKSKRIPQEFKTASVKDRLKLLAGIIDSDGHNASGYYSITTKWKELSEDISDLARSLGFKVTIQKRNKKTNFTNGEYREYYYVNISGNVDIIPVKIDYKNIQTNKNKNPCRFGPTFKIVDKEEYFGFEVDGDNRFLLGNYIVTHNSGKGFAMTNFLDVSKGTDKIRDVDEWKKAFQKIAEIKNKFPEIQNLNLRNPDHVAKLHLFVAKNKIKEKTLDLMLADLQGKTLPNIVFDVTLKDKKDMEFVIPKLLEVGYDPKDIHLVWVLTNFHVAVHNNKTRDRIVPDDILLQTHEGASKTMFDIIKGNLPKGFDGEIHIINNNKENTVFLTDKNGKPLQTVPKFGPLKGQPQFVIKDFLSIKVKDAGKSIKSEKEFYSTVIKWMDENIPKSTNLDDLYKEISKERNKEEK